MQTNRNHRDSARAVHKNSLRQSSSFSAATRERVLRRYEAIEAATRWHGMRSRLKQAAWWTVVRGTGAIKRMIDIAGAIVLLIVLSPLLVTIAIIVKLNSRGPVLYKQTRVMKWGRLFEMYKFRSMHRDAELRGKDLLAQNEMAGGVTFKMKDDPRITTIGRLLRRGSIDELPQLWNVLKGEMSLVGPRPPIPSEVARYSLAERRRLDVTPGMTGLWQVTARRDPSFERGMELDREYIRTWSLGSDLRILLKTFRVVLQGSGD